MGFPIVVGAKSVSSRPLVPPSPFQAYSPDGTALESVVIDNEQGGGGGVNQPRIAVAVCPKKEWMACISLSYFKMVERESQQQRSTVVEIRVQISHAALPFSSSYRDGIHLVTLPETTTGATTMEQESNNNNNNSSSSSNNKNKKNNVPVEPFVSFSPNRRFLTCLIPFPYGGDTVVLNFQLRKPAKMETARALPPLPSYIAELPPKPWVPVATNPQLLQVPSVLRARLGAHMLTVTAICGTSATETGKSCTLLAGCRDGSILALCYRPCIVAGILYVPTDNIHGPTSFLTHITDSYSSGEGTGRLVAIRESGEAFVFVTHMSVANANETAQKYEDNSSMPEKKNGSNISQQSMQSGVAERNAGAKKSTQNDCNGVNGHASPISKKKSDKAGEASLTPDINGNSTSAPNIYNSQNQRVEQKQRSNNTDSVMMRLVPLIELRGDFISAKCITGNLLATLSRPSDKCSAQVWAIFEDGTTETISNLVVSEESLNESHATLPIETLSSDSNHIDSSDSLIKALHGTAGIEYDSYCGCLSLSSAIYRRSKQSDCNDYSIKHFVCLWHWKTNVVGFTAATMNISSHRWPCRLISRLYFTRDQQNNRRLSHIAASLGSSSASDHRIRKHTFETGVLAPPRELFTPRWGVQETSSLLLFASSVAFPVVSRPASTKVNEVEWREERIPAEYINSYGSPQIATIGRKHGQSIAVASAHGVCILDCTRATYGSERSWNFTKERETKGKGKPLVDRIMKQAHPKWRMFGNVSEEKSFCILAMVWWEGSNSKDETAKENVEDDLLVAVIQLEKSDSLDDSTTPKPCYLVCWSPRRLDVIHQLLTSPDALIGNEWGVELPCTFRKASLKILAEPTVGTTKHRRAVVLLSSSEKTDTDVDLIYSLFQLQLVPYDLDKTKPTIKQNPYTVLIKQRANGIIKEEILSQNPIAHIFLASASFQFNLSEQPTGNADTLDPISPKDEIEFVAIVGIIQSPRGGVHALMISPMGAIGCSSLDATLDDVNIGRSLMASEVTNYWLADVVKDCFVYGEDGAGEMSYYVWTFLLGDGRLLCWSVPYIEFHKIQKKSIGPKYVRGVSSNSFWGTNVKTPKFSCSPVDNNNIMFGIISKWKDFTSSRNRHNFWLGCVPGSPHGCVLCVRQDTKMLYGTAVEESGNTSFAADVSELSIMLPSAFTLEPPLIIFSVFALILEASFVRSSLRKECKLPAINSHTVGSLQSSCNQDAVFMSLQLLVRRATELLAEESKKEQKLDNQSIAFAASIFGEVVDVMRTCTTELQFTTLLLEVSRQIEPSCFPSLFPLPLPPKTESKVRKPACLQYQDSCKVPRSISDLFNVCMKNGALTISLSALPLLSTGEVSLVTSLQLFRHCLEILKENTASSDILPFDYSVEERHALPSLFRFGFKIEDTEFDTIVDQVGEDESEMDGYGSGFITSSASFSSDDSVDIVNSSFTCGLFGPSGFIGRHSKPSNEDADISTDIGSQGNNEGSFVLFAEENQKCASFAGAVAIFLHEMIFTCDIHLRWKRISALAVVLLGPSDSMFERCTALAWLDLAKSIRHEDLQDLATSRRAKNTAKALFVTCMQECSREISAQEAGRILDLCLILLKRRRGGAQDLEAAVPALVVIILITAHASNQIGTLLGAVQEHERFLIDTLYEEAMNEMGLYVC